MVRIKRDISYCKSEQGSARREAQEIVLGPKEEDSICTGVSGRGSRGMWLLRWALMMDRISIGRTEKGTNSRQWHRTDSHWMDGESRGSHEWPSCLPL